MSNLCNGGVDRSGNGTLLVHEVDEGALTAACDALKRGGVVALPTDTIYGLCCLVDNTDAINRIYGIKGRDFAKPLAICVSSVQEISKCVEVGCCSSALPQLLPGGVTVVLPRRPCLNPALNPSYPTVGVRVPDHPFIQELCAALGVPIALTSANRSKGPNATSIEGFKDIWDDIDVIVDGGQLTCNISSTVVEIYQSEFKVIRAGRDYEKTVETLRSTHGLKEVK